MKHANNCLGSTQLLDVRAAKLKKPLENPTKLLLLTFLYESSTDYKTLIIGLLSFSETLIFLKKKIQYKIILEAI